MDDNQLWIGDRPGFGSPPSHSSSSFGPLTSRPSTGRTISDYAPSPAPPSLPPESESTDGSEIIRGAGHWPTDPLSSWESFPVLGSPSMIPTSPTPPPNTQNSFRGHGEHFHVQPGANTFAGSLVGTPPWQQLQVNRAPCPYLAFLEDNGVTLNHEQVKALETIRHTGVFDTLASFLPVYHQAKAQQMPRPTPTAPPSVYSSFGNSTVTGLAPSYACPGLDRTHGAIERTTGRHACPMCGHRSDRKNDIRKHMTLRNSAVGYRCQHGTITRKDKYTAHLKRKHNGAPCDEASVSMAEVSLVQHYPETCLHCHEPISSWEHWFSHWMTTHNDQSGRDVLPMHWPVSAVREQTPRPNLAIPPTASFGSSSDSRLVESNLRRWETYRDPLEGLNTLGMNFPRQEVREAMQGFERQFTVLE